MTTPSTNLSVSLPRAQSTLVDDTGRTTREFYYFFRQLATAIQSADLSGILEAIRLICESLGSPDGTAQNIINVIAALAGKVDTSRVVAGAMSVAGGGTLDSDVILTLKGDRNNPGDFMFYGTDAGGSLGWLPQGVPPYEFGGALPIVTGEIMSDQVVTGLHVTPQPVFVYFDDGSLLYAEVA